MKLFLGNITRLVLLALMPLTYAQVPHVYSQYFINSYVYNPALAGVEGHNAVFLMHRMQWTGIEGAPTVSHLNWHTPLKSGVGIGMITENDRLGPLTGTTFMFTGSYLINLDRKHFFRFGLSLGVGNNSVDFSSIVGSSALSDRYAEDLALFRESSLHILSNFGVMYHFDHFNVGFALPYLFPHRTISTKAFDPIDFSPLDHMVFKMNYRHSLFDDAIAVEPHFLYRYSRVGANQFEATGIVHIKHLIWLGAAYREHSGIIGLFGFKVAKTLAIGYAFDASNTAISDHSSGTHEVHVGLHIGSRFDHVEHSSSFIKSHKIAKDTLDFGEEDTSSLEEADQLPTEESVLPGATNQPTINDTDLSDPYDSSSDEEGITDPYDSPSDEEGITDPYDSPSDEEGITDPYDSSSGEEGLADPYDDSSGEEGITDPYDSSSGEEGITDPYDSSSGEEGLADPYDSPSGEEGITDPYDSPSGEEGITDPYDSPSDEEGITDPYDSSSGEEGITDPYDSSSGERAIAESTEDDGLRELTGAIAVKGAHLLEMPLGSYVIVGSFVNYRNAERFSEFLLQKGYITRVGYNSERKYFYVDIFHGHDVYEARKRRDELRLQPLFSDAWVITIIEKR